MGAFLPPHQYSLVWSLNGPLECIRQEEIPECSAKEKNLYVSKRRKLKVAKGQKTQRQERHSRNPHSHVGLQAPEMETKHPKSKWWNKDGNEFEERETQDKITSRQSHPYVLTVPYSRDLWLGKFRKPESSDFIGLPILAAAAEAVMASPYPPPFLLLLVFLFTHHPLGASGGAGIIACASMPSQISHLSNTLLYHTDAEDVARPRTSGPWI